MYKYAGKNTREFSAVCRNNFGRDVYVTNKRVIDDSNIIDELGKALYIHNENAVEIDYLNRYYEGDQPILYRQKKIRPDVNNKIVMNLAYEAVERHVAETFAEPIQYVLHGTDEKKAEEVTQLNKILDSEDKQECDIEIGRWRAICGTSYRFVGNDSGSDIMDESDFSLSAEDPRYTFVAYFTNGKPAFSCQIYENENGEEVHFVYTKNKYYEIVGNEIRDTGINGNRMIPVIEYPNNARRLSNIEMTIFITDALNTMASERINGISQFVSAWIKFVNCEVDQESFLAMQQMGALVVKSNNGSENKADVDVMCNELNQTETQVAFDDLFQRFLSIQGLATRESASGSDTGTAANLRNGHYEAQLRNAINEPILIKSERQMLKLILNRLRINKGFVLVPSDIEVHINHNKMDNLLVKAEVLEILIRCGIDRKSAVKVVDMFSDPEQIAKLSADDMKKAFEHMIGATEVVEETTEVGVE